MSAQDRGRNRPETGGFPAGSRQEWAAIPRRAATDAGGLDPALLGDFPDRLAGRHARHAWTEHDTAAFAALGSRAAEGGVSLGALVDLYLSAAWRAWPLLPSVAGGDAEAVVAAGVRALRTCDDAVAALAEGHAEAGRARLRREVSLRREFVDDLLAGSADPSGLLARAESYGLRLAGTHLVLLAADTAPYRESGPVFGELGAAVTRLAGAEDVLLTTREGRLVLVLPPQPPDRVDALVAAIGARGAPRVALGRAYPGPGGAARSYREAGEALHLAGLLRLPDPLVRVEDLLVYRLLLRDRTALAELVEATLGPLREARGGAGPLLHTLAAYLDSGGNATEAARRLHLSVRAVTYRLDRVATLTGLDPTDPAGRYPLHTAVLGARLLDREGEGLAE